MIHIQPELLVFLQDAELADPIVVTLLALEHGYLHALHMSPSGLQIFLAVPISGELMGILTPPVSTRPVGLTLLAADLARGSFFSPQCEGHLSFQHCGQDNFDRLQGCFGPLLHSFNDLFAFFPLEMLARNGSTYPD